MNTTAPHTAPGDAAHVFHQPRRWLVLLAMTGSLSMIFVDMTVVGIALPSIGHSLGMSVQGQTWVVSAYLLTLASLVALGGRISDLTGKVPAFLVGVVGFAGASMVCGIATDGTMLIAGRVLQGLSACLMQPASSALVVSSFAPGERGKAMAVYVGIPLLFLALGPALGGLVVQHMGWRWVFYLNLPVAALAVLLTAIARPRDSRSPDRRIDWAGGALLLGGLPLFVYGVQQLGAVRPDGSSASIDAIDGSVLAALAIGAALLVVFVRHQWRAARPLLRLRLFADRALCADALVIACMQFAMTGFVIQGSIYAQEVLGFDPFLAGASLLPMLVPVILIVHVAGRWYDRAGVRSPVMWGTACATVGQLVQALGAWMQNYPVMAVGMAIMGTGIALTMSPTNTDALSRVPAQDRGQVSGLVQTLRQIGGTIGVAATAAAVIFAQSQLERGSEHLTHAQLQAMREGLRSEDPEARRRALGDPSIVEARGILASSMAAGGLAAALATGAAFALAFRLMPRGAQRPSKAR